MNLVPDFRFKSFSEITVEFLKAHGICALLLDIDNTLEPYENAVMGKEVLDWFFELNNASISYAVISNNNEARVKSFLQGIDIPAFSKAGKPFSKKLLKAMEIMGSNKENTLFIGDQIFTDVWAAHNAGVRAALVLPIKDKRDLLTKFKRLCEKPFLRKFEKLHENEDTKNE
jgi:HAD superfamily phosphatase (TIGR01668 family)